MEHLPRDFRKLDLDSHVLAKIDIYIYVCMCIYIYIYTCTYIYMCVCIYMLTQTVCQHMQYRCVG